MTNVRGNGNRISWWLAVVCVMCTYGYFLIFGEFALIEMARPMVNPVLGLNWFMAWLGAGGILGSLIGAVIFQKYGRTFLLRIGFALSSLSAGMSLQMPRAAPDFVALLVGLSLGFLTVVLSTGLKSWVGRKHLGRAAGLGTGLAYALCNIPEVFTASPRQQAWLAAALAFLGVLATFGLIQSENENPEALAEGSARGLVCSILVLMTLVWLDSAAFYVILHNEAFKSHSWSSDVQLYGNAAFHFGAALLTGWFYDRKSCIKLLVTAWAFLSTACLLVDAGSGFGGWVYVIGVSIYSTVLVASVADREKAWQSALIYSVSGWLGSAMGMGMAQHLGHVPLGFLGVSCAVIFACFQSWRIQKVMILTLCLMVTGQTMVWADEPSPIEQGRRVYIAEGCIHCHSQYIRSGTRDELWWGPATSLDEQLKQRPPLFGNRRQGPDLAMVGNRRTREWNRMHLINPRSLSPGSRMPAYANLFVGQDGKGNALLEYLDSLGKETMPERLGVVAQWAPAKSEMQTPADDGGKRLFGYLCMACHGPDGRGDGLLSGRLSVSPPNWQSSAAERWKGWSPDDEQMALARIIKFGLPGTPMAGHETLSDGEVVSLARYVMNLQRKQ